MISRRPDIPKAHLRLLAVSALALLWTRTDVRAETPSVPEQKSNPTATVHFEDVVNFHNGDQLHGRLLSLAHGQPLAWHAPHYNQMLRFPTEALTSICLQQSPPSHPIPETEKTAVILTNNDLVFGKLMAMDDKTLTLVQESGPPVVIRRPAVTTILAQASASGVMYSGPKPGERVWELYGGASPWKLVDNQLVTKMLTGTASINRIPLGPELRLQFRLTCADMSQFWLGLDLSRPNGVGPESAPQLRADVNYNVVQLMETASMIKMRRPDPNSRFEMPVLPVKDPVMFTITVSSASKQMTVYVNGTELGSMPLSKPLDEGSFGLIPGSFNTAQIAVDNILLLTWGTHTPSAAMAEKDRQTGDVTVLLNHDTLVGPVTAIQDGSVTIQSAAGELKVPLNRIRSISLDASRHEKARPQANDVGVWMNSMANFTFALEKIDESGITGTSENFGRVKISRGNLRKIEFNIHRQPTAPDRTP